MLGQAAVTLPYSLPDGLLRSPLKLFMECITCLPSVMDKLLRSPPLLSDVNICKRWMLSGIGDSLKMPLWKELEDHCLDYHEDVLHLFDKLAEEVFGLNFMVVKRSQLNNEHCGCDYTELRDCLPSLGLDDPAGFDESFSISQLVNQFFFGSATCARGSIHLVMRTLLSKPKVLFLTLPAGQYTVSLDAIDLTGRFKDKVQVIKMQHVGSIFSTQEGIKALVKNQAPEWKSCWIKFGNQTVEETSEESFITYHGFCLSIYQSEDESAYAKKHGGHQSCTFDNGTPSKREAESSTYKNLVKLFEHLSLDESG